MLQWEEEIVINHESHVQDDTGYCCIFSSIPIIATIHLIHVKIIKATEFHNSVEAIVTL